MAQISAGQRAKLTLGAGEVYRISTTGQATVTSLSGAPAGTTTLNAQTADFGPYGVPAVLQVQAVLGACDYSTTFQRALTPDEANVVQNLGSLATAGDAVKQLAAVPFLAKYAAFNSTQAALSTTASVALTPTASGKSARIASTDLKRPVGSTTDATGYAAGVKTITLASAGTGAFYKDDVVTFAGQSNEYELLAGDSDVSNGGTITLKGYGLAVAIPAAATAITLVRRGPLLRVALNCDNDVEGLLASQADGSRDLSIRLGEEAIVRSDVAITRIDYSANASLLANSHRIDQYIGS